jgi:flagellar hook-associated protein 2
MGLRDTSATASSAQSAANSILANRGGTITFGGLSSGLPTNQIIDQLLELERQPIQLLELQKAAQQERLELFQDFNTKALALRNALRSLDNMNLVGTGPSANEEFRRYAATSSDSGILTATAGSSAQPGKVLLRVDQLAAAEREVSQGYAATTDVVGTGTFSLTVAGTTTNVTLDASSNTLQGLATAINDSGADVTAFLLNDGSGTPYRLVVTGNQTGASQTVVLDASGLSGGTAPTFTQTQVAQNASVVLDPGANQIAITSTSNTVNDVIQGVTLELGAADPTATVTVGVEEDTDEIVEAISAVVTAYNAVVELVNEQAKVDPTTNRGGPLIGDATLLSLQRRLSSVVASSIGSGGVVSAGQLGIDLQSDGTLAVDEDELRAAIEADLADVAGFFAGPDSFADQLRVVTDSFVDPVDGALVTRIQGANDTITELDERIAAANDRLSRVERDLVQKFAALERAVSGFAQQTSFLEAFLQQQQRR